MSAVSKNDAFDYGKIGTAGALIVYLISNISPKLDAIHEAQIQEHADLVVLVETIKDQRRGKVSFSVQKSDSTQILSKRIVKN